jgi:hypothetical protein
MWRFCVLSVSRSMVIFFLIKIVTGIAFHNFFSGKKNYDWIALE